MRGVCPVRKGKKEGKICLPTLAFKLISCMDMWIGGLSVLLLSCFLTCWFVSAKRERGNLLRPCGVLQLVWKQGHRE